MQSLLNFFRKKPSIQEKKLNHLRKLTMELREINNNRSLAPDVRIQKVIAIADQALIAVTKT